MILSMKIKVIRYLPDRKNKFIIVSQQQLLYTTAASSHTLKAALWTRTRLSPLMDVYNVAVYERRAESLLTFLNKL